MNFRGKAVTRVREPLHKAGRINPRGRHCNPQNVSAKQQRGHDQVRFIPGKQGWSSLWKSNRVKHHVKSIKKKNHIIVSTDTEKAFAKFHLPFMIKTLSKLRLEGNFLTLVKNSHKNLQQTSYLKLRN